MKKIPYGKTDYKDLVENNCYYVDKTMYIEKLENNNDTILYHRPRRFGKTLFTSMIGYYYDIKSKDLFDYLFKDTYIHKHPTQKRNSYYVLKFDFSGINSASSEEELKSKFNFSVRKSVERFLSKYNLNYRIDYSLDASEIINSLFTYKFDHQIYILIDEYDNFTNSLLKEDASVFTKILGKDGFVRDFYAILKQFTGDVIGKIFITGVCSISLDSVTSGFNIATNITNDYLYNAMTGITHDELKKLINDLNIKEDIFKIMEENYDGYKFSPKTNEKLFNPNLAMYFLNYYTIHNEMPDELLDTNIYSDLSQIENIVKLFNNNFYQNTIKNILENKYITSFLQSNFTLSETTFDLIGNKFRLRASAR